MDARAICRAAGITPPPEQLPLDWRFEHQLPIIRTLLAMQRKKLLRLYVDGGEVRLMLKEDNYRRELTWEQAGKVAAAWREECALNPSHHAG